MKYFFLALSAILLLISNTQAQTYAGNTPIHMNSELSFTAHLYSFPYHNTKYSDAKKTMIAGFVCMGAGATLSVVGLGLVIGSNAAAGASGQTSSQIDGNDQNAKIGTGIAIAGAVVFVAGTAMAIGGGISMHSSHRFTLIAPRKDQLGLAYNF